MSLTRRLALTLAAGAAIALAACDRGGKTDAAAGDIYLGRADAPVTVYEYASVACVHCAAWDRDVWPEFKRKYIDTGQVRYAMREILTAPVPVASAGFLLARCAGKERYFEVVDALFRSQAEMARTGDARGTLLRVAQSSGMTEEQFQQCITNEDEIVALNERVERFAGEDNVTGTPTFVVNGKKVEGEPSLAALDAAIQPLLKNPKGG